MELDNLTRVEEQISKSHANNERRYWLSKRESLLIELRAIEDMLGIPRTLTQRQVQEQRSCDRTGGE